MPLWEGLYVFWYTYRKFLVLLLTYSMGIPYRNPENIKLILYHWDIDICKHHPKKTTPENVEGSAPSHKGLFFCCHHKHKALNIYQSLKLS